jgi:drug/metabolite transporter (DMT)-like permease
LQSAARRGTLGPVTVPTPLPPSRHGRGLALMITATGCFTANVLLVRELGRFLSVSVWTVAAGRFLIGLAMIAIWYRRQFRFSHLFRNRKLFERGVAGGVGVALSYEAVVHLGAGLATFINSTYVFWAAFMAAWVFRERLRRSVLAGSSLALAGIGLLTGVLALGARPNVFDLFAVCSALSSAYVAVAIRQLHATEHTSTIFGAQCVFGLALCGPPAALHLRTVPVADLALLVVAGLCAGAGQIAQTYGYRDLPVAEGSLLQLLGPVGAAVGGALCFGEKLSPGQLVGAALVLIGATAAARRRPEPAPAPNWQRNC